MGGFSDILGTIAVDIVGDYSQLQADFNAASASAEQAGQEIASAFNSAGAGASAGMAQIAEGNAAVAASSTVAAEAIEVEEGAVGALLGRLREIGPELLAGFGFVEFGKSVIEATGHLQQATVALTALTGSAEEAQGMLAELRDMSDDQALSFPALIEAAQRMEAFGIDTNAIKPALQAAADASVALNRPLGDVADALDRIALSGTLSSRQLATIGVSMHDLAIAMGTTDDQSKTLFADLDESTRIEVLTTAIENVKNFQGLAEKAKDTIPGMTQQIKNAWETAFQDIGTALAPVIAAFGEWVKSIGQAVDLLGRLAVASVNFVRGQGFQAGALPGVSGPAGPPLQVQDTATRVNNLVSTFNQDLKTEDWKEAEQIIATLGKLDAPVAQDALQRLVAAQHSAADAQRGLGQETEKYKAITGDVTNDLQLTIGAYQRQQAEIKSTAAAIQQYGAQLADAGVVLSSINLPQEYFNHLILQAKESMDEAMQSTPPYVDSLKDFGSTLEQDTIRGNDWIKSVPQIQSGLKGIADGSFNASKSLDEMMGKLSGPELSASAAQIFKIDEALGSDDWRRAEQVIRQLAVNDLPAAVEEYGKLIEAAREHGAAEGEILALQQKELETEISDASQRGVNATAQMVALKNSQIQTQLLIDKSQALGQVYVDLTNTFMNAWGEFSSGIADAITSGKNFGDTMMGVLKKIEQEILNTLVGFVFKQMRDSLLQSSGLLSGIVSKVQGLGGGVSSGPGMSGPGMLSAMGGGGGGAGGGLSALGSGGLLGGIAAVGTLISGIVGNFQQAHANKVLGEIELNTRSCFNVLAQMQGSLTGIGPYASLASQMKVSGPVAAGAGGGGTAINFNNCTFSGLTQDMVNALFASALRQFKAAGG